MFGMLDYRAHKLYALLHFPLIFLMWITTIIVLPIVVYLASVASVQHTVPNRLAQLLISFVALEIVSLIWALIVKLIGFVPSALFNFLVDPIPADGRTKDQARLVVQGGQRAINILKLEEPASQWTDETIRQVSHIGFLQRVFYGEKVRDRLSRLRHYYRSNPTLPQTEYNSSAFFEKYQLKPDTLEHIVCNPLWRNMVLRYGVLVSIWLFAPRV